MKLHWKVLLWMVAGVIVGLALQWTLEAPAYSGLNVAATPEGVTVEAVSGPSAKARIQLAPGDILREVIRGRGSDDEQRRPLASVAGLDAVMADAENGEVLWFVRDDAPTPVPVTLGLDPESTLGIVLNFVAFPADIFMALLKMLIVPLVLSSIISAVAGIGSLKDLGRLGGKTFLYYMSTSLLAILIGQTLVNVIHPGDDAQLGLSAPEGGVTPPDGSLAEVFKRMVPTNIFESLTSNGAMLAVIFFALLFGYFITRTREPHCTRLREFFESAFQVMMAMAQGVLKLLPYGVFFLMVKVVAGTGFGVFRPLLLYMLTVALALVLHFAVTLPILLKTLGGISPLAWFRAMSPALMTAFSTSSSSGTLPVTMETVELRGRVSNRVTAFTLPLGATINMDGTALYECIGVIFLAQFYASSAGYELTLGSQAMVVIMALMASVGAAGIPSAGLVMMLTILAALNLPLEGATLLLAVDRPLDMLRTVVNVWSDSCGAAIISRSEGEKGPLTPIAEG